MFKMHHLIYKAAVENLRVIKTKYLSEVEQKNSVYLSS